MQPQEATGAQAPTLTPCDRCGAFAPLTPRDGQALCDACLDRLGGTIADTPFGVGEVLRDTISLLGPVWTRAALGSVALQLPVLLLAFHEQGSAGLSNLFSAVLSIVVDGATVLLTLAVIERRPPRLLHAMVEATSRWGSIFVTRLLARLLIILYALLLVVPGIQRALSYALAIPMAASGESRSQDALDLSLRRMEGHRAEALAILLVAWIPAVLLVGVMLALMGLVTVAPEAVPGLTEPLIELGFGVGLSALTTLPMIASTVMYAKLRSRPYIEIG